MSAVVAGDDKLADPAGTQSLLDKITHSLLTRYYYPNNYHENFNELNREEIFTNLLHWMEERK